MSAVTVTDEAYDPRSRYRLYRLCHCVTCGGDGKEQFDIDNPPPKPWVSKRCPECRGEGRVRQEVASCESPEAVGVALVTLAREGEWKECPFGLLDRYPECEECEGAGRIDWRNGQRVPAHDCPECKGSGVKPTGTWLILPWLPSARNVTDAARTLARSKKPATL